MTTLNTTIKDYSKEFDEWYDGGQMNDAVYEILYQFKTRERQVELLMKLLEQAYDKGLRVAAQDSVDTLRNFATNTAGLPAVTKTPEQIYVQVALDLAVYLTKAIDNFEKTKHGNSHS